MAPTKTRLVCSNCAVNVYRRCDDTLEHTSTETHYGGRAYLCPGLDPVSVDILATRGQILNMRGAA
jgi:hypothetical protein